MTAKQIKEEVRSFVPSHNGDIHDGDGDERLCKEDIITFTKKTTTGMTTNKVTQLTGYCPIILLLFSVFRNCSPPPL